MRVSGSESPSGRALEFGVVMRAVGALTSLCFVAISSLGCGGSGEIEKRPHVLIYLVDTLRPDRLGCYGYSRPTSPNIDAFAAESTLFENAIGQSTWTRPSVASLFTGVWPPAHGATGWKHKLSPDFQTLAESLDAAGYRTAAFVGNPQVIERYGFAQGFDDFTRRIKRPSIEYTLMVESWLDGRGGEAPFFIYVHTMDPHAPYAPSGPFMERFAPNDDQMPTWQPRWKWPLEVVPFFSDRYDGEIAANDESFGRLLEILRDRGLYDDSMIILTSDHGEEFKEHGHWRHGANLHAETLNVPLLIKYPGQRKGRRVKGPVQHIDLMPTILDHLGLAVPMGVEGRSLTPASSPEGPIFSHLFLGGSPLYHSVVEGSWKLIRQHDRDGALSFQLYHWTRDPGETTDLASTLPGRTASLAALLENKLAETGEGTAAEEVPLTEELEAELKALGYLQ